MKTKFLAVPVLAVALMAPTAAVAASPAPTEASFMISRSGMTREQARQALAQVDQRIAELKTANGKAASKAIKLSAQTVTLLPKSKMAPPVPKPGDPTPSPLPIPGESGPGDTSGPAPTPGDGSTPAPDPGDGGGVPAPDPGDGGVPAPDPGDGGGTPAPDPGDGGGTPAPDPGNGGGIGDNPGFGNPGTGTPSVNYGDEIFKLIRTAFELRGMLEQIIAGGIPTYDVSSTQERIALFMDISTTIYKSTTQLVNKVDAAHIKIGFAITRAVLRLINLEATSAMLAESRAELKALFNEVSQYRDLKPTDRATVYVKARLDAVIWQARFNRDKILLGQNPTNYQTMNRNITKAVGTWFRPGATVADVINEINNLDATYQKCVGAQLAAENPIVAR